MKRVWLCNILLALLLGNIVPVQAVPPAQGGSVSGTVGHPDQAYIEYTVSGAGLKQTREGIHVDYEGAWSGGPITFSGKLSAKVAEGYKSFVTLSAHLADQTVKWPQEGEDNAVSGRTVELPFSLTYDVPPDYDWSTITGGARVEMCGGVCDSWSVDFTIHLPTPEPTVPAEPSVTPGPSPTPERTITIRGTTSVIDPDVSHLPALDSMVLPILEADIKLMRNGKVLGSTFTHPPDGSFEFQVPVTDSLVLSTTLVHIASIPTAFKVVSDQSDDAIWIATEPFDLDEYTPDVLVKEVVFGSEVWFTASPGLGGLERVDDVTLIYRYAREAWQMGAILLGQPLDLPTLKIRAFSTDPDAQATGFWYGPMTGVPASDTFVALGPAASDFRKRGSGDMVMHEFGHHFQADSYANSLPYDPRNINHQGYLNPTTTDSWTEGFASFFALWTKKDQIQSPWPQLWHNQGTATNLELNHLAWTEGEEYAVAALLWDLVDPISGVDATEMPVTGWASLPAVTATTTTAYGDYVKMERDDLWRMLSAAELASFDTPFSSPAGYPYIFDVKQLYETLQANGVGLLAEATPNGLDAVDELFIAHGFFDDTKPHNLAWDLGEAIGETNSGPLTVQQTTYPGWTSRRSPPPVDDSYLTYQVLDKKSGGPIAVEGFQVSVEFEAPHEAYNYSYLARPWDAGRLPYIAPPSNYVAMTRITPTSSGIMPGEPLAFSNNEYWQQRADQPIGAFMEHEFEVEVTAGGASTAGSEPGSSEPSIIPTAGNLALPALLICGGLGGVLLVIVVLVAVGKRSKRKRDASAVPVQAPGMAPAPVRAQAPAAPVPQPAASGAGWQLVVEDGPGIGQRYSLGQSIHLGRGRSNEVHIEDGQASRQHAVVETVPGGYVVTDLGSTNGTFVNGRSINQRTPLSPGDRIRVGTMVLRLDRVGAEPQARPCPQCGHGVPAGTRFCGQCGSRLG